MFGSDSLKQFYGDQLGKLVIDNTYYEDQDMKDLCTF